MYTHTCLSLVLLLSFSVHATGILKGALYSPLIWLPMKFNLFYNLQMVLANVLYFFTGHNLTLVHSLVQT